MKTIIIDDEQWMLRHLCEACAEFDDIELMGSYRNPLAALEYAENNAVDLAFIDMEMPQLDGAETAKRLTEIWPEVKVIIVTAYDEEHIEKRLESTVCCYLRKPYDNKDLRLAIDKAMMN